MTHRRGSMKTLRDHSGDTTALNLEGRPHPHPSYLLMITVVTIQLVKVRGALQREGLAEQGSPELS